MAGIRAVLVGVDQYERSDIPRLHGCVNDVALVRWLLKRYFGVPNERMRVVVNARATKANIVHRLQATIRDAQPGDVVVFYFSGHGSQVRDRDGDELADALDELICPYDMSWDRRTYILDDDLDDIFAALPPGVLLEAFFDCCFYGAAGRGLGPMPEPTMLRRDVRYLPPPFDIAARAEGAEDQLDPHRLSCSECFRAGNIFWAASHEGQSSAEDFFEGRTNGIFTYWGCRFITENFERLRDRDYSREQLLEDLRAYLHELGYPQTPELSGPRDMLVETPLAPAPGWGAWVERGHVI